MTESNNDFGFVNLPVKVFYSLNYQNLTESYYLNLRYDSVLNF
jgi:hypothetical protein